MAKQQAEPVTTDITPEVVSAPTIRAKFQCANVMDTKSGDDDAKRIFMFPVTGDNVDGTENENKSFAKLTPSGTLEILVTNPAAFDFFASGGQYYLDLTKAN